MVRRPQHNLTLCRTRSIAEEMEEEERINQILCMCRSNRVRAKFSAILCMKKCLCITLLLGIFFTGCSSVNAGKKSDNL